MSRVNDEDADVELVASVPSNHHTETDQHQADQGGLVHRKIPSRDLLLKGISSQMPGDDVDVALKFKEERGETDLEHVEHIDALPDGLFLRIISYLKVWELSTLRLVSHRWDDFILNETYFTEDNVILLNLDRISPTTTQRLLSFSRIFRKLRVLRLPQHQVLPNSVAILSNLNHLDLFRCGPWTWPVFLELLLSVPALEELRVRKCAFKWPYDAEEWKHKYIEWQSLIAKRGSGSFPNLRALEFRVKDPHDALYMIKLTAENSDRLSRLSYTCRTPQQGLRLNSGVDDLDDMYETVYELYDTLVEVLRKMGRKLELFHNYLIDPTSNRKSVSTFTDNGGAGLTIMSHFCSSVLARTDGSNLASLKSFCLYGGEIFTDIPKQMDILQKFLNSLSNGCLDKVILPRIRFASLREFDDLLRSIPRSISCIRIPSYGSLPDFLSSEFGSLKEYYVEAHGTPDLQSIIPPGTILPQVRTFSFYNCSDWIWQTVKLMTIVNSFPCLTELLIRDDGAHQCTRISDSDVQNICRYFPNLRKLHMTNVDCVTDFGFTGIFEKECKLMNETGSYMPGPGTKIGYSFTTLKSLEYLFLSKIGGRVTNVSLFNGFTFQNLRLLVLEGYPKVTPWGVEHLMQENPNLKRWNINFHDRNINQLVERLQHSKTSEMRAAAENSPSCD